MKLSKFLAGWAVLVSAALAQTDFYLKDKDVVVFYGDSITDQRMYTVAAEAFVLTRFPQMQVRFVHSGWGGDRVTGGGGGNLETRLKRDVLPFHPTVVTIMLGMNDGRYRRFDEEIFNAYTTGMEKIVALLREDSPAVRVTLIEPSPYDDVTRPPMFTDGYNSVLVRYGAYLRELAKRTPDSMAADMNSGVVKMLRQANQTDAELAKKIIPDRVHPGWAGHLIMAAEVLKAWHAPALVTKVEIDAKGMTPVMAANTTITGLRELDGALVWTQKDLALPMPLPDQDAATLVGGEVVGLHGAVEF